MDGHETIEIKQKGKKTLISFALFFLLCVILWHVPPFSHYTKASNLKILFLQLESSPYLYPVILLAFIVAGITMFPITVLTTAVALFIGIEKGLILSIIGCILSATFTFWVIKFLGAKPKTYLLSKEKIRKLNRLITDEGITSIMILRMVPIGYTLISVTAALSDIKFSKYLLGTILGVLPDLILCIFLAGSFHHIIVSGNTNFLFTVIPVGIIFIILWYFLLKKFIAKFKKTLANTGDSNGSPKE